LLGFLGFFRLLNGWTLVLPLELQR
jgi:hypothetical protein